MTVDAVSAAWFALEITLRPLAAAAAVALVLWLLRVRSAAVVHSAWSAVLFAMLLMPMLLLIVPALPIPVPAGVGGSLGAATHEPSAGVVRSATQTPAGSDSEPASGASAPGAAAGQLPSADLSVRTFGFWLPPLLLGTYVAGVLVCLARLFCGWRLAGAMIRRAKRAGPIPLPVHVARPVYESSEVTVPMTIGAIRPVIVLPPTWTTWPPDTLAALLAHEAAHVRRRDASINFAAHLNRAIFWFHPLAWWLGRKLAVTAEHVCDEAAAGAIAAPDRYAAILVDMAEVVRRSGGRLSPQAVSVNGAGLLERRIDRLLRGDAFSSASRGRKIAAAIGCTAALALAIACRQQIAAAPLREDPVLARRLADQNERTQRFTAARDMTQDEADALEQRLALDPEDFDARRQLVTYYRTSASVSWDRKRSGLRRHALWLIEHAPEHDVAAPPLSPAFDPEGFAEATRLWEAHLAAGDVSPFLVYRAAAFFAPHDPPRAERLILRGLAIDPDSARLGARMPSNAGGYGWPTQLAALYAAALRGSDGDVEHSPYATRVRRTLEETTDATLLARVGSLLTGRRSSSPDPVVDRALEEVRALGVRYLTRSLELDPGLESAKAALARMRLPLRATDADRLANQALEAYMVAEDITEYSKKDLAAGKRQRDEARARAEEVLSLAAAHPQDPAYSAAVMTAHHVLATAALRDGDRDRAVHHLRASVSVPASEQIQYAPPFSWIRPVNRLLREGERDRVLEFFEAFARLTISERDRLLKDAQALREGRMPVSYQQMLAREGR